MEGGANYLFNEKVTDSSLDGAAARKMERSQEGMAVSRGGVGSDVGPRGGPGDK